MSTTSQADAPTPTPSFGFCLLAALPPAAIWCCLLPAYSLVWWLPVSIAASNVPIPDGIPLVSFLHLYAAYDAIDEARWEYWASTILGTLLLSKAMGLTHESIWDAFEPLIIGRKGHGAGTQKKVMQGRKPDMRDKDGKPLGRETMLAPGTQIQMDIHDGRGYRPFVIPGDPIFSNEKQAIRAFFTTEELAALKAAGVQPWEVRATTVLTAERVQEIREEKGLWRG